MTQQIDNAINTVTRSVELKTPQQEYQAGVCNIGGAEREKRRILALFGGMFAFSWPFLGFVFIFPIGLKLLVFIPAFIGVLSLMQYRSQFCAYFGLINRYRFNDSQDSLRVIDQRDQELDKNRSLRMIAISLGISLVYTLLVLLLI